LKCETFLVISESAPLTSAMAATRESNGSIPFPFLSSSPDIFAAISEAVVEISHLLFGYVSPDTRGFREVSAFGEASDCVLEALVLEFHICEELVDVVGDGDVPGCHVYTYVYVEFNVDSRESKGYATGFTALGAFVFRKI
jgi:hypothetical protein